MMFLRPFIAIALAAYLASGAGAWAQSTDCDVPPFEIVDGLTITGRMTVKAGKQCSILLEAGRPGFLAAQIMKPPAYGRAAISGREIIYTPGDDYIGRDRFIFFPSNANRYRDKALLTIDVTVDVVP